MADARDLCTIADVKAAQEPSVTTTTRDPIIQTLITSASVVLMRRLQREFTPQTNGAARIARVRTQERGADGTLLVDLAPWDLREATAVVLHPESSSPLTLVANSDYMLEPLNTPQGVYNQLRLSRYLVAISDFEVRFGFAQLQLTGNWGIWQTSGVDSDVRDACVLTVRSWLRQNPGQQQEALLNANLNAGVQPAIPATWFLPRAALDRLAPWARWS